MLEDALDKKLGGLVTIVLELKVELEDLILANMLALGDTVLLKDVERPRPENPALGEDSMVG